MTVKFDTPVRHDSFDRFKGREDTAHYNVFDYGVVLPDGHATFEDFRTGKKPMPDGIAEVMAGGLSGLHWNGGPIRATDADQLCNHARSADGHSYAWWATMIFEAYRMSLGAPTVPPPPVVEGPRPLKPWFPIVGTPRADRLALDSPKGPLTLAMGGFELTHTLFGPSWLIPACEGEGLNLDYRFGSGVPGFTETRKLINRILDARLGKSRKGDPSEVHLVLVHDAIMELVQQGQNVGGGQLGAAHSPVVISYERREDAQMACHQVYYTLADILRLMRAQGPSKRWKVQPEYARLGRFSIQYSDLYRGIVYIIDSLTLACGMIGLKGEYQRNPDTGELFLDAGYHDAFIFDDPSLDRTEGSDGFGIGIGGSPAIDDIPRP